MGENNTLYYTKSLLSNGLYSIIYSHYLLKIKNKNISIVCEIFTCELCHQISPLPKFLGLFILVCCLSRVRIACTTFKSFNKWSKVQKILKNEILLQKLRKAKIFLIKPGGYENCSGLRIELGQR
jgi:hypothetical protein